MHDKATHESKGSAFVWYANRADAERAILQFNFRHVLPDPSGDQDRPLVVRRAKTRAKPLKTGSLLGSLGAVSVKSGWRGRGGGGGGALCEGWRRLGREGACANTMPCVARVRRKRRGAMRLCAWSGS